MSRGLYIAASSMFTHMQRQESLANALANVNTPGYKADQVTSKSFEGVLIQAGKTSLFGGQSVRLGSGTVFERTSVDLSQGTLVPTSSPLDLALDGSGFFVLQDDAGVTRLTRDGHFKLDEAGFLITTEGFQVMDINNAAIQVGSESVEILRSGVVMAGDDVVGQLRLVEVGAGALLRAGSSSFIVAAGTQLAAAEHSSVRQGQLEGSNVNSTRTVTEMMNVARSYESAQRIFSMQNQILGSTVNDVGRV